MRIGRGDDAIRVQLIERMRVSGVLTRVSMQLTRLQHREAPWVTYAQLYHSVKTHTYTADDSQNVEPFIEGTPPGDTPATTLQ